MRNSKIIGANGVLGAALLAIVGSSIAILADTSTQAAPQQAALSESVAKPSESVAKDVARLRAAVKAFASLDRAVAAGYARDGGRCIEHQPHGAMGFHHPKDALYDDRLDVERPEILVYERLADGTYRFNGVEYVVPFSAWPETKEPPMVLGQKLKPAPNLKIWYLHVWTTLENPSGLFADWNPSVKCTAS
jgi:hypothetical protein